MNESWMDPAPEAPRRILVVDDEPELSALVQLMLERATPHRVTAVSDPLTALELFETSPSDLVISDIEMPGMNGLDLLERVKALRPRTAVIMLTGQTTFDMAVKAIHRQAFDFLEKPPSFERLVTSVHNAIAQVQLREALEATLGEVAAAKSRMERFGREHLQQQLPHERLIVAGLLLAQVRGVSKVHRDGVRASLEKIAGALNGPAELIEGSVREEVESILRALERLTAAEQALESPLAASRRAPLELDINTFVRDEVEQFFSIYDSMESSLQIPRTPHLMSIRTSGVALALVNVLENAVQATSRGGRVVVECGPEGRGVRISVEDDGPGFRDDYLVNFAQAFRGTKGPGHAGLGLAIARQAIEEQGGSLVPAPSRSGGARVEVRLP